MMIVSVIYMGEDLEFAQRLALAAKSKNISFSKLSPTEILDFPPHGNLILNLDLSLASLFDALPLPKGFSAACLPVLALPQNTDTQNIDARINLDLFDDLFTKFSDAALLQKKIVSLQNALLLKNPSIQNHSLHELHKKNHNLTRQIAVLQTQLSQVDSDLHIQQSVIRKINQITNLSRQINSLDMKKIASVCIEQNPHLIDARFASLYTYNPDSETLSLLHHNHPNPIDPPVSLRNNPDSPMASAIRLKDILVIKDFGQWINAEKQNITRPFCDKYNSGSCIIAPLPGGGSIPGILNLADKIDGPAFDAEIDLPPVRLLCEIIGSAMYNIKLYQAVQKQAQTDGLTGLLNHRSFFTILDREVLRARRYGTPLSLLMIDMDNLKIINDDFGHLAGDAALLHVAKQIAQCIRESDIAARYGGDEFAVILPGTSIEEAHIVAQRLNRQIADTPFCTGKEFTHASVSIGLNLYTPLLSTTDFMNHADSALLAAKNSGKNRIHIAPRASEPS